MISKKYLELLKQMEEIHKAKSAGYSGKANPDPWANFRKAELLGVPAWKGCLIRLSDKFSRMTSLVSDPSNDECGENLKDTLIDLSAYALIAICLIQETEARAKRKAKRLAKKKTAKKVVKKSK